MQPVSSDTYGCYEVAKSESTHDINCAKLTIIRKHLVPNNAAWPPRWTVDHMLTDWRCHEPEYQVRVYAIWTRRTG